MQEKDRSRQAKISCIAPCCKAESVVTCLAHSLPLKGVSLNVMIADGRCVTAKYMPMPTGVLLELCKHVIKAFPSRLGVRLQFNQQRRLCDVMAPTRIALIDANVGRGLLGESSPTPIEEALQIGRPTQINSNEQWLHHLLSQTFYLRGDGFYCIPRRGKTLLPELVSRGFVDAERALLMQDTEFLTLAEADSIIRLPPLSDDSWKYDLERFMRRNLLQELERLRQPEAPKLRQCALYVLLALRAVLADADQSTCEMIVLINGENRNSPRGTSRHGRLVDAIMLPNTDTVIVKFEIGEHNGVAAFGLEVYLQCASLIHLNRDIGAYFLSPKNLERLQLAPWLLTHWQGTPPKTCLA